MRILRVDQRHISRHATGLNHLIHNRIQDCPLIIPHRLLEPGDSFVRDPGGGGEVFVEVGGAADVEMRGPGVGGGLVGSAPGMEGPVGMSGTGWGDEEEEEEGDLGLKMGMGR